MAQKLTSNLIAIAEYVIQAKDDKMSVLGIFDNVSGPQYPATQLKMSLAVTFLGEPGTTQKVQLRVLGPNNKEVLAVPRTFNVSKNGRANVVINFEGFTFEGPGQYKFVFEQNGAEIVSYVLDALLTKDQQNAQSKK